MNDAFKHLICTIFRMYLSPIHCRRMFILNFLVNVMKNFIFSYIPCRVPLLSSATNQYLRDQLVYLTEQFSALTLPSTDRMMREVYMQSSNTFIIEKRNLSELVIEMANYTNRAIMKKLEAIRNLVTISEQSYRRFAETDEATRNETVKFMEVSSILMFLLFLGRMLFISE